MKILQLMPEAPAQAGGGGQIRLYHFARRLSEVAELTLAILAPGEVSALPQCLKEQCGEILQPGPGYNEKERLRRRATGGLRRVLTALVPPWKNGGKEFMMAGGGACVTRWDGDRPPGLLHRMYASALCMEGALFAGISRFLPTITLLHSEAFDDLRSAIHRCYSGAPPDIIWCEHSYLYPFARRLSHEFPGVRIICNAHNVEYLLLNRIGALKKSAPARRWMKIESSLARRLEREMLRGCESVLACSEVDAEHFRRLEPDCGSRVMVSPNGVDTGHFAQGPSGSSGPVVLFTGSAGYPPNDDAVSWMITGILPKIREQLPECRAIFAGLNADIHWSRLIGQTPGVEVAANVPDMRPYFARARVSVVPLRSGSGTRLKILEAMSMGRAVVSTSAGAEGLAAVPGEHYLQADDAGDFARAVVELLTDDARRSKLENSARSLVNNHYDWDHILDETLEKLGLHERGKNSI